MDAVIDACSAILLAKSSVLEEFAKWKKLVISKGGYNEVLEGKDKKLFDALLLERLVGEKKIIIKNNIRKELVQKLSNDFGLGVGEAESIALVLENNNKILVTDNKQGRKAAKVQGLNLTGSIGVVMALYKIKNLDKDKAMSAINILKKTGWFQDYLIEKALEEIQNE